MSTFETLATVDPDGTINGVGVPFAPGTEVDISIIPKSRIDGNAQPQDEELAAARSRMRDLFATIKGFRMTSRIPREELYERGSVRWKFTNGFN